MLADDDDDAAPAVGAPQGQTSQQPAWMRQLHDRCLEWIGQLPGVSNHCPAVLLKGV
jgi:dynein heavy chain 1